MILLVLLFHGGISVILFNAYAHGAVETRDVTTCKLGHGYPVYCPRPSDPANHTKCCRHLYSPKCCQERAGYVCSPTRSGWDLDPDIDEAALFCPGPDQSDEMTACCKRTINGKTALSCCSVHLLGAILGGVLGGLALIAIFVVTLTCYLVRTGRCKVKGRSVTS